MHAAFQARRQQIIALVRNNPSLSKRRLARMATIGPNHFRPAFDSLVADGILQSREEVFKTGKRRVWTLSAETDKPADEA
jgi:DNA-binding transcriptional regulator YhcF (GntR family)